MQWGFRLDPETLQHCFSTTTVVHQIYSHGHNTYCQENGVILQYLSLWFETERKLTSKYTFIKWEFTKGEICRITNLYCRHPQLIFLASTSVRQIFLTSHSKKAGETGRIRSMVLLIGKHENSFFFLVYLHITYSKCQLRLQHTDCCHLQSPNFWIRITLDHFLCILHLVYISESPLSFHPSRFPGWHL